MTDALPEFDARKLIALVRKGEPEAIRQAYAFTFGTDLGRLVLAHHLASCGVGRLSGSGVSTDDRHYAAGQHDAALMLAEEAGYGQAALAVAVLTDELTEENSHGDPRPSADPDFAYVAPLDGEF